ncbi:cyclin-D2-1-like [Corylus avellana]|uniref:cyclin-D2-1-like n=1 Tax=Corylus avellana TaxID=13451 RepID=UPI00286A0E7B|nr:cyclin-D2-1-like [Corylus avellana]
MSLSPDYSAAGASLYCGEDAGEVASWVADTWISHYPPTSLSADSPPYDESTVSLLIDSEPHHAPHPDYLRRCRDRSIDITARQDSINWILKVHAYYRFRPVTALLSVNYLDRFLSSHSLLLPNGWPFQLLSVACLSLAAKMEEPQVPLLLDLQVSDPEFVFAPSTVQRMELSVMTILNWRLRSVTPFDFLDYFISKLPSSSSTPSPELFNRVFYASSDLILSTTRAIDFLGFAPSTVAAAAVLCATAEGSDSPVVDSKMPVVFHERVNKEMVRSCLQLMQEYLIDTCPAAVHKDQRIEPAPPPSPIGVLDAAACGSCDTRSENPGSTGLAEAEPPFKRLRSSAPDVQQR